MATESCASRSSTANTKWTTTVSWWERKQAFRFRTSRTWSEFHRDEKYQNRFSCFRIFSSLEKLDEDNDNDDDNDDDGYNEDWKQFERVAVSASVWAKHRIIFSIKLSVATGRKKGNRGNERSTVHSVSRRMIKCGRNALRVWDK